MALDWRKLWVRPAPAVEALPLLAQAIDALARRHVDDAGLLVTLPNSVDPTLQAAAEEVAFRLRARPAEVAAVVAAARLLLEEGVLLLKGRDVSLGGFVEEQRRVEPAALRQRAKRERDRAKAAAGDSHGAKRDGHGAKRDSVTEEIRRDETDLPARPQPGPEEKETGGAGGVPGGRLGASRRAPRMAAKLVRPSRATTTPSSALPFTPTEMETALAAGGRYVPGALPEEKAREVIAALLPGYTLADVEKLGRLWAVEPPRFSGGRPGTPDGRFVVKGTNLAAGLAHARRWDGASSPAPVGDQHNGYHRQRQRPGRAEPPAAVVEGPQE